MKNEIEGFDVRLVEMMAESGISQANLCRITGLASSMISHYCTGQRIPSVPVAVMIAKALNTTVDYLASGEPGQARNVYNGGISGPDKKRPYSVKKLSSLEPGEVDKLLVYKFRSLSVEGKAKVFEYVEQVQNFDELES